MHNLPALLRFPYAKLAFIVVLLLFGNAHALAAFTAYHDVTGLQHQQRLESLVSQGFRVKSISVYGDPSDPRYATIYVQKEGPLWQAFHGLGTSAYQRYFDTWSAQGYKPAQISVTGTSTDNAVFAGVFEKDVTPYYARHSISRSSFERRSRSARDEGYILHSAAVYGTAQKPLFAAVWEKNTADIPWGWALAGDAYDYQSQFNAGVAQFARPQLVTLSSEQQYLSVWYGNWLTGGWEARHNMTSQGYQTQLDQMRDQGYYPMAVQAGGVASKARFAAVFVKSLKPIERKWTVTGKPVASLAAFDEAMKNYMQSNNIRAGSLAVTRKGKLVLAHAYTWSVPDYPITQPTSTFRLASCSKPLTAIAIMKLVQDGKISLNTSVQEILNLQPPPNKEADPRLAEVRIWHLLSHLGGWDRNIAGDPFFMERYIADQLGVPLPIDKQQITTWMTGQSMQSSPGAAAAYSNYGFSLLGQVIEKLTGQSYLDFIRSQILDPLGIPIRAQLGHSQLPPSNGEVRYHGSAPSISRSTLSNDQPWVPAANYMANMGNFDSFAQWIMSPADYAKVLAAFDSNVANPLLKQEIVSTMWSAPFDGRPNMLRGWFSEELSNGVTAIGHNGVMIGTAALGFHRSDDISIVVFFNKNVTPSLWIENHALGDALNEAANNVVKWPEEDFFPTLNIARF